MTEQTVEPLDLRALIAVLRRQYKLALLTVVCTLGLALAYLFQATPMYTATALVLVDPRTKNILSEADAQSMSTTAENARLESEVVILTSPTVLLATIQNAALLADAEFGPSVGLIDKAKLALGIEVAHKDDQAALLAATMTRLDKAISVRRQGLTYVLNVSVTTKSPERSARLANALVQTYIGLQVQSKVDLALGSRDLLQSQLDASRQSLAASEENLDSYIQSNIEQIRQETGDAQLAQLSTRVSDLEAQRQSGERVQAALQTALAARDWQALSQSLQDDALQALQDQRDEITARLSQEAQGSAGAQDLAAQLLEIDDQLAQTAQSALSSMQAQISDLAGQSGDLRRELRTRVLTSELSATTLTALYSLQQEADISQRQYTTLITRMRDLEAQAVVQLADSRVVSPALAPTKPASPNTRLVLALALVAGLGLGLGLAFLNEYYVGGVASGSQLANLLPIPVGAVIPLTQALRENASVADTVPEQPLSVFSESFRKLRASIDQAWRGTSKGCKVIMITSAVPGEGKTSIALSLARTYALSGKNVLLIDADLRKPSLHKHVNSPPRGGLLEYLSGDAALAADPDFFVTDPLSPASLILGGGRPVQATDQLLQSDTFAALIEMARARLDIVIIDTSPLVPVVDARYIAPYVDAALLVVRFSATTQTDLRYAYDQLSVALRPGAQAHSVLSIDEQKGGNYRYSGYYNTYTNG